MKYSLPLETINKIMAYLGGKPFAEVSAIIEEIRKVAEQIEEEAKVVPMEQSGS